MQRTYCLFPLCVLVLPAIATAADTAATVAIPYADHSNLLVLRDPLGNERPIKTKADWNERFRHVKANMQLVMGPLPDESRRVPLDVEIISEETTEKYLRKKVKFTPEAGDRVPAWLLIPRELPSTGKTAA